MKKVLSAFAFMALVVVGLLLPAPASAAVTPVWEGYGSVDVVSGSEVKLTKATPEGSASYEAADLNMSGSTITVDYALSDTADFVSGAVRLFVYDHAGANTMTDAPTAFVAAEAKSGTLTITGFTGTVGTAGLVYDSSNSSVGTVTFTDMRVGGTAVNFNATTGEEEPTPTPSASESATPTPTPSASESKSADPSASASPSGSATSKPSDGPTVVTVPAPTMGEVTCDTLWVNTPDMDASVEWSFGEQTDTTIVVIAKAKPGYVFADGKTQLTWTLTFKAPTGCEATPAPTATETAGSGGSVGSGTDGGGDLPVTGAKVLGVAGVGGLLVAIGGLLFVWARRKRDEQDGIDPDATVEMRAV